MRITFLSLLFLVVLHTDVVFSAIFNVTFKPIQTKQLPAEKTELVKWEAYCDDTIDSLSVQYSNSDSHISDVIEHNLSPDDMQPSTSIVRVGNFTVKGKNIGFNDITVSFIDKNNTIIHEEKYKTSVILSYQLINDIFTYSTTAIIIIANINMGATLDLTVIKKIVYKPIGPIVGIVCQYIVMPMLAFVLGLALFNDNALLRLGLFLNGCCPGGGSSNMYTLLLGGSLDLSIMMTFCSSILAFAALPLWVLTMGPVIMAGEDFTIPYDQIAIVVVSLAIPLGLGILIQFKCKRLQVFLEKTLTPIALFNILYTFTFGVYSNRYIFDYFTWQVVLAGMGLPWVGYTIGTIVACIFRLKRNEIIAISVETGLQNALIALVILKTTLEAPTGDIAFVVPASAVLMTPIPLLIAIFVRFIRNKFFNKDEKTKEHKGQDNLGMDPVQENQVKKPIPPPSNEGIDNMAIDL